MEIFMLFESKYVDSFFKFMKEMIWLHYIVWPGFQSAGVVGTALFV